MEESHLRNTLIIEEASLELLPSKFLNSPQALEVEKRFGVVPSMQILDRNFHSKIVSALRKDREKRGRPDLVHYALLDATSTPLFQEGKLGVIIHSIGQVAIEVLNKTRPPRTLDRFCGVMSKLISGRYGAAEEVLFKVNKDRSFEALIDELRPTSVVTFSPMGTPKRMSDVVHQETRDGSKKHVAWIVGGFPAGDFASDVLSHSDLAVSISNLTLTAHVVVARLCYELENCLANK